MMVVAMPPELAFYSLALPTKPAAPIRYAYVAASPSGSSAVTETLVVFLNGLLLPQVGWHPAISLLLRQRKNAGSTDGTTSTGGGITGARPPSWPAMLTYDRFGQGQTTSTDPGDAGKEAGYGHDVADVAEDLHTLLQEVCRVHGHRPARLVLVGNSIGCAIARVYAQRFERRVAGLLLLDSIMANSDFVSMFPDPDAASFDPATLPPGVTPAGLRDTRAKFRAMFHPSVANPEGLSRRDLAQLLPASDAPALGGLDGAGPQLLVVGHDPDWFASESARGSMQTPEAITQAYTNPTWHRYNEGLVKLTRSDRYVTAERVPFIATGCGHFVQRDDPALVARLANDLINAVADSIEQNR